MYINYVLGREKNSYSPEFYDLYIYITDNSLSSFFIRGRMYFSSTFLLIGKKRRMSKEILRFVDVMVACLSFIQRRYEFVEVVLVQ